MNQRLREAVEAALGLPVARARSLAGGDISAVRLVTLEDGGEAIVKANNAAPPDFFAAEARGLDYLRETATLRVPSVLAIGEDPAFLVLEYLRPGSRVDRFDALLGRGLAAMHRSPLGGETFGLDHDNFIGSLAQPNGSTSAWPAFFEQRRLRPQVQLAVDGGRAPASWEARFERLYQALPSLLPEEPPSRLHGDLWSGNLLVGPLGEPCLIDPAVYRGHREVDLAMMQLFGGFDPGVFQAYQQEFPLQPQFQRRVPLYQLYPLLVHVNLFGSSYVTSVERALHSLGYGA